MALQTVAGATLPGPPGEAKSPSREPMIITQAVREAGTEQEIYLLLTAYVRATRLGGELGSRSTHLTRLPLTGRDDVRGRIEGLFTELGVASRGLDDESRVVIKEAFTFSAKH